MYLPHEFTCLTAVEDLFRNLLRNTAAAKLAFQVQLCAIYVVKQSMKVYSINVKK